MKIGIITQPLHCNYGGLLQNFALQKVLITLGHKPITIDQKTLKPTFRYLVVTYLLRLIGKYRWMPLSKTEEETIEKDIRPFAAKYITKTPKIITFRAMRSMVKRLQLDGIVVGSDQVWRPKYNKRLMNSFLDFLCQDRLLRISYAASFGADQWELTPKQTQTTKRLIKRFHAVSVREQSAVALCKKHWGIDAELMPDPTFLVEKKDYIDLIEKEKEEPCPHGLLTYILDCDLEKKNLIKALSEQLGLQAFTVTKTGERLAKYPSVTHWLRGFLDAEFVVCDSFHGTVFSIIFNKPFVVLANSTRGNTRFESLLSTFGLTDRIITTADDPVIGKPIDWDYVNRKQESLRLKGLDFLRANLGYE